MDKNFVLDSIKKTFTKDKDIITISLVGSFLNKNKFDSINDLDLVIILKDLKKNTYNELISKFNNLKTNLSNNKFKFIIETGTGPIKPKFENNKKIVQLHLLIYDSKSWKEKDRKTILYDWSNFNKTIIGKQIKTIQIFSKEDLILDLNNNINLIKNSKCLIGNFYEKNNLMKREYIKKSFNKRFKLGLVCSSIITSFKNYIRLYIPNQNNDYEKLMKLTKVYLNKENQLFFKEIIKLKKEIYLQKPPLDLRNIEKRGVNFIKFLLDELKV